MNIDNLTSLILSVYNNKGVYALLLGSGISLEAKIMSGWKVTEDLIKKVTVAQGEEIPDDPFEWYRNKCCVEAEYSNLLEQLGKKPSELESILRPYFEASEEDEEQGYKKPTAAHKAIAEMAKRGYFKLIITTNFDQLLETALSEQNVKYQTICHENDIEGKVPLYHHPLTVLKINGDYKDCRFRNTEKELSEYPLELVDYLTPVLKNFGLITCGWSATWDIALIELIAKEQKHRYSYYFTYLGDNPGKIGELAERSGGEQLRIEGADDFFTEMNERLKALETINEKNMEVDAEVAIARVKEYIPDSKKLIKYSDLYERMTNKVIVDMKAYVYGEQYPSASLFEQAIADNLNVLSVLLPTSIVAIKWAENAHYGPIVESLYRVANRKYVRPTQFYEHTRELNHTVDTILLYGLGIACVYYKKFGLLDQLFKIQFEEASDMFSPYIIDKDNCWLMHATTWNNSTGSSQLRTPFSTTLCRTLRTRFDMISNDDMYESTFCIFEKLLAMYYYYLICKTSNFADLWPPMGSFTWNTFYMERSGNFTFKKFFEEVIDQKENSQLLKSGMFEGKFEVFEEANTKVNEYARSRRY